MMMGLPFVASDIDPIKETVVEYQRLHPPGDAQAFLEEIELLYLERAGRSDEIRRAAVERFGVGKGFDKFYTRLVP